MSETNGSTPKRFSLKRKEIPLELEDDSGEIKQYILREITGTERDAFLAVLAGKTKYSADGKASGMKDMTGVQADLLSRSLFSAEGKQLDKGLIGLFPSSAQTELFTMALELSGLKADQAKEEAKND